MDDGERGNNGNYPENRPHAIEDPTDDEQHNALRALHKADLTQENEGLGTGASVTHHHGASGSDRGEDNVGCPAAHGVVDQEAHVEGHVRIAVKRGIVECAEGRDAVLPPRHLPIQHVQETGKENDQCASEETANGKESCRAKIHNQSEECQEVGIDSCGGNRPNYFVKQPFAAGSNCPR